MTETWKRSMPENSYRWEATARVYELDSQNIVNNAIYLNYLEQCRNDFARHLGIDFHEYYRAGYNLVVARIEIDYLRPLRANDAFYVTISIANYDEKRVCFQQTIQRKDNNKFIAKAVVYTACVDHKTGRACMPESLKAALNKGLTEEAPKL